jgi:hypothetical protein
MPCSSDKSFIGFIIKETTSIERASGMSKGNTKSHDFLSWEHRERERRSICQHLRMTGTEKELEEHSNRSMSCMGKQIIRNFRILC